MPLERFAPRCGKERTYEDEERSEAASSYARAAKWSPQRTYEDERHSEAAVSDALATRSSPQRTYDNGGRNEAVHIDAHTALRAKAAVGTLPRHIIGAALRGSR